ncbi:MAG: succinylglutamate desuccinylase/aspartoacylase family protein [Acidobacteria bacterium]|nr:succinylglutamate desuccinylase/aspartoacylase family protein [Acidobacteriota bacterium]
MRVRLYPIAAILLAGAAAFAQPASRFLQVGPAADIPVTEISGARPGPTLVLVAGTHGYEYTPILALERLRSKIQYQALSGKLILVHVANMPSFLRRTIYYGPEDGKNLNRVFPGKPDGTLSERIAYVLTQEVIERADYLIDLHCGDGNESLRPYAYWMRTGNQALDERSRQMAVAFGMNHIVIDDERPSDPAQSMYCSNTAATRGKPAITVESGGLGATDEESIARLETGLRRVMSHLKMTSGESWPENKPVWIVRNAVLRSEATGLFYAEVKKDQQVRQGDRIGTVTDFFGKTIFELRAPFAGVILYVIGTPPINKGEPLAMIGVAGPMPGPRR